MRDPLADPEPLIRRVYAYVAYRIGDGPDAEDVTSETLERALRYRKSFDPRRGNPTSWLIGIARRCIADAALSRVPTVADVPEQAAPGQLESDALARVDLARALEALDDRERELIALRYGADLTAKQIGELLDLKTNAVEVALHRTLRTLRTRIDAPGSPKTPKELEWLAQQRP
jgi:RNA polymerase sigma-70 factor (ECF subfamily)